MTARTALVRSIGFLIPAFFVVSVLPASAQRPSQRDGAQRIAAALGKALPPSQPAVTNDVTFLRRVSIDLTGNLPDAEDLSRFVAAPNADKRSKVAVRLLASDPYAVN